MFYFIFNPHEVLGLNFYRSVLILSVFSFYPFPNQCRRECLFKHVGGGVPDSTQQWLRHKGRILVFSSWPDISVTSCDLHNLSCFPRGRRRKWRWVRDLGRVTLWALAEEARRGKVMVVLLLGEWILRGEKQRGKFTDRQTRLQPVRA